MASDWADTAVLLIACNRPAYLERALNCLFQHMDPQGLDVFVSQDGQHRGVSKVIQSHSKLVYHLQHLGKKKYTLGRHVTEGYFHIALHYQWALSKVFSAGYQQVIVLEDDLEIAPDFFDYFKACLPLLEDDPSIWAISAWNDFGFPKYTHDAQRLYRSDFFPGLGWMISAKLWQELEPNWPNGFWDEWMRHPHQRKNRVTIRPEISRTYTFGRNGVSCGQYFDRFLKQIRLNQNKVDFSNIDLDYLHKNNYDSKLKQDIEQAESLDIKHYNSKDKIITYRDEEDFKAIAKQFGIMWDFWSGIPRTSYRGVVILPHKDHRVFIIPDGFS